MWTTDQATINNAQIMLRELFAPRFPLGGGSQTGAQLARLELFSATERCRACERAERNQEEWIERRNRYNAVWPGEPPIPFHTIDGCEPPDIPVTCRFCGGVGYVHGSRRTRQLDARPKGSSVPVGGALIEFSTEGAQASIVMRKLSKARPEYRDALTAYHGSAGDYAETNCGSRMLAVVTLTRIYREFIAPEIGQPRKANPAGGKKARRKARRLAKIQQSDPQEPTPPKFCHRFDGEHPQSKRLMRDDVARWIEWYTTKRIPVGKLTTPPVQLTLGPEARPLSAGEALLSELVEWRTSSRKDRAVIWTMAEQEAEQLFATATVVWEQFVQTQIRRAA
jgi:hypothetical protein